MKRIHIPEDLLETHIYQIEEKTFVIKIDWKDSYYKCPVVYTYWDIFERKQIWSENKNPKLEDIILFTLDPILSRKDWKTLKSVASLNSSYYP